MSSPLPPPASNQTYVTVSPIPGGFITLSDHFFVHPADQGAKRTVPSLTFLIKHPGTKAFGSSGTRPFHMMFDLGLRKAKERYPEVLQKHIDGRNPFHLEPGVAAQLKDGGLNAEDVDLVLLSHVHYDHHGDPEDFPNAQFRIGHGAMDVIQHGLGGTASHQHFVPGTLPEGRSGELPDPKDTSRWKPLGPFLAALDLFEDGSVYVIDTPGHLPGHCNLLCRMKDRWVLLCGDAFHDRRLLTGEKEIGTWELDGNTICIHVDKEQAAESIRRLREFDRMTGDECELIAAHEEVWWANHKDRIFPGVLLFPSGTSPFHRPTRQQQQRDGIIQDLLEMVDRERVEYKTGPIYGNYGAERDLDMECMTDLALLFAFKCGKCTKLQFSRAGPANAAVRCEATMKNIDCWTREGNIEALCRNTESGSAGT